MCYGGNCIRSACNVRTQIRRDKRRHTLACLRQGMALQERKLQTMGNQVTMYKYGNITDTLVQSLSIQLADCQLVGHNIHYAAVASCAAKSAGYKTQKEHKQHLRIHKQANIVKHNLFELLDHSGLPTLPDLYWNVLENFRSSPPQLPPLLPPPPPPHLPELDGAIQCLHLEEFRRGLFAGKGHLQFHCGYRRGFYDFYFSRRRFLWSYRQ